MKFNEPPCNCKEPLTSKLPEINVDDDTNNGVVSVTLPSVYESALWNCIGA